jgi:hypothetical protein
MEWEQSLNRGELSEAANRLLDDVNGCPHIGHEELLLFIFNIEDLSCSFSAQGVGHVLDALKDKYFAETNDSDPLREYENIVRWVATDHWKEKRSSWNTFMNWVAHFGGGRRASNDD